MPVMHVWEAQSSDNGVCGHAGQRVKLTNTLITLFVESHSTSHEGLGVRDAP